MAIAAELETKANAYSPRGGDSTIQPNVQCEAIGIDNRGVVPQVAMWRATSYLTIS